MNDYGFKRHAYPVIALLLCLFKQTTLCGLLLGFVVVTQKDLWITRNTFKAFVMCFVNSVFTVLSSLLTVITWIPFLGGAITRTVSFTSSAVSVLVIVLVLMGIKKVAAGEDFKIPLIDAKLESLFVDDKSREFMK